MLELVVIPFAFTNIPAGGWRDSADHLNVGSGGCYWSSAYDDDSTGWFMNFVRSSVRWDPRIRWYGCSIRFSNLFSPCCLNPIFLCDN